MNTIQNIIAQSRAIHSSRASQSNDTSRSSSVDPSGKSKSSSWADDSELVWPESLEAQSLLFSGDQLPSFGNRVRVEHEHIPKSKGWSPWEPFTPIVRASDASGAKSSTEACAPALQVTSASAEGKNRADDMADKKKSKSATRRKQREVLEKWTAMRNLNRKSSQPVVEGLSNWQGPLGEPAALRQLDEIETMPLAPAPSPKNLLEKDSTNESTKLSL